MGKGVDDGGDSWAGILAGVLDAYGGVGVVEAMIPRVSETGVSRIA